MKHEDVKEDKALIKKVVKKEALKGMKKGGATKKRKVKKMARGGGVEQRGKTRGKFI